MFSHLQCLATASLTTTKHTELQEVNEDLAVLMRQSPTDLQVNMEGGGGVGPCSVFICSQNRRRPLTSFQTERQSEREVET